MVKIPMLNTPTQTPPKVKRFTDEPLSVIIEHLVALRDETGADHVVELEVLDPDRCEATHFNGERVTIAGIDYLHRHYQTWLDLAQSLGYSLLTPRSAPELEPMIRLRMRVLGHRDWHSSSLPSGHAEKYGAESHFARLNKAEEPHFHQHLLTCARWVGLNEHTRVLSLGVNSGAELKLCLSALSLEQQAQLSEDQWVGIDHSASAIERARDLYNEPHFSWRVADLRALDDLSLGKFDLIICLNTLHSPLIDERQELKRWVSGHLHERGGIIISLPQSRYVETQQLYGDHGFHAAQLRPSKSLKMVTSMQRYLQQHRFEVHTRGKYTLFMSARRLEKR